MSDRYLRVLIAIKNAKQGRKGANEATEQIRSRAEELLHFIEDERHKSTYVLPCHTTGHLFYLLSLNPIELIANRRGVHDSETMGAGTDSMVAQYAMHSHDPIAGCEAYEDAKRMIQKFRSQISRYETVNSREADLVEPKWMRWKQDALDLTALNNAARKFCRQIAEGHLSPSGWTGLVVHEREGQDQELSQIAMEILDETLPNGAATWGATAAEIIDAYGRMLKDTFA